MEPVAKWDQLHSFRERAEELSGIEVWLFGSALASAKPTDLDVLVIYTDRRSLEVLRAADYWAHYDPPIDLIAMTPAEERFYRFKVVTRAVRLV